VTSPQAMTNVAQTLLSVPRPEPRDEQYPAHH
jgi:hypothetical protein